MRRSAEAAHFANCERAHDGRPVGCSSVNYFDVGRTATESLEIVASGKDVVEIAGKGLRSSFGIALPGQSEDLGSEDDCRRRGICISLGRVAVFRAGEDR